MFKTTRLLLLALSISLPAALVQANATQFKMIHANDLATMIQTAHPYIFDANNAKVRAQYGTIPGAMLLSSSSSYEVSKVLPADKQSSLVFYCANTMCMASHSAASRAVTAGYHHVYVMSDGIMGWKSSGHPTAPATN